MSYHYLAGDQSAKELTTTDKAVGIGIGLALLWIFGSEELSKRSRRKHWESQAPLREKAHREQKERDRQEYARYAAKVRAEEAAELEERLAAMDDVKVVGGYTVRPYKKRK